MNIREWNAVFVLMGGSVVCSGCMVAQPLSASHQRFPHLISCKHEDEDTQRPWATLHEILDNERG